MKGNEKEGIEKKYSPQTRRR